VEDGLVKETLLFVLALIAIAPVAVEAQQDLAELEEIGGVYFERGVLGRGDRFTGNVVKYQWYNGCYANVQTAVQVNNGCFGRDREAPGYQEKGVQIDASLIDGVFHGRYIESNYLFGGAAHSLVGQYNSGSKCGKWASFFVSTAVPIETVIAYTNQPVYQETFPPC
jgi:hypothetical protein